MRPNIPLIGAVIFLAAGLCVIFGYGQSTASMNMGYPIAASALQVAVTTTGPAVLGGLGLTAIGLLMMIWAIFGGIGPGGPVWYSRRGSEPVDRAERPARRKWFEKGV